ncbi:cytochrome P460 family protein [Dyella amyloliquefaciens]|uniref:cytochrome P460 family protein n=1 Tax=Dyella amyloliquefaciens TaxID=1770545 RepID=UPI00102ECB0A|nr:cytochrome P460 family protein [Dyella amyloliquefaciens]
MRKAQALAMAAAAIVGLGAAMWSSAQESSGSAAVLGGKLPDGYRDWKLISVAHEEGSLNDIRAILGNEIAVKAYREGTLPFPDGAIIARIAWAYVPSEENNKAFGRTQSFVAGHPTNVQFMVKHSREYASTGGWGFAQFNDGAPSHVTATACYACHVPVKDRDFVFTRYSP